MIIDMNYLHMSPRPSSRGRPDTQTPGGLSSAQAAERAAAVVAAIRAAKDYTPAPQPRRRTGVLGRLFGGKTRHRREPVEQA